MTSIPVPKIAPAAWFLFRRTRLQQQMDLWRRCLPTVAPHYAVKCNNDPELLRWIQQSGGQFDCASPREMQQVLRTGARPSDIVYAHPCKSAVDIRRATRMGVPLTVVDSPEEVLKLVEGGWKGGSLIRLMVPDSGSLQPFSRKFGAPLSWVPEIKNMLNAAGIRHMGWSFHVGSLCKQPAQFKKALAMCADAGTDVDVVDIGGGFIPDEPVFVDAATQIREAQGWFPSHVRWIAEPGRFLATPAVELLVRVTGMKPRLDTNGIQDGWRYTLDESIYGSFSNIAFDGQTPVFELIAPDAARRPMVKATLFGRTCDSADCLASDIAISELRVGDWIRIRDMGAYTLVSSSEFNGFPTPHRLYDEPDRIAPPALRAIRSALEMQ